MKTTLPLVLAVILVHTAIAQSAPLMPNFIDKDLTKVFDTFDNPDKVVVEDISGDHRHILWPKDWKVCTQSPEAGTPLKPDAAVKIGVVKKTEDCPKAK
ncbi:hypothetical protein BGZ82_005017 [Podila clonocystis]|nr:hypothetical protein BGZ82_005017 [Podila clonocystis]